jgi:DHA2 family multidrug resistance protein
MNVEKDSQSWIPTHNPWLIALAVMLATFMEVLDTTIVNVALRHIAGSLAAGNDEATWVVTSYLVSNAIILPASGWLAIYFGRKRFLMTCVVIFTISSFLCGFAPSLAILIIARIVQGARGGGLQPIANAVMLESFPVSKRGIAMAVGAGDRTNAGRMDYRQLFMALGLLHQYSHRHSGFLADESFS